VLVKIRHASVALSPHKPAIAQSSALPWFIFSMHNKITNLMGLVLLLVLAVILP